MVAICNCKKVSRHWANLVFTTQIGSRLPGEVWGRQVKVWLGRIQQLLRWGGGRRWLWWGRLGLRRKARSDRSRLSEMTWSYPGRNRRNRGLTALVVKMVLSVLIKSSTATLLIARKYLMRLRRWWVRVGKVHVDQETKLTIWAHNSPTKRPQTTNVKSATLKKTKSKELQVPKNEYLSSAKLALSRMSNLKF